MPKSKVRPANSAKSGPISKLNKPKTDKSSKPEKKSKNVAVKAAVRTKEDGKTTKEAPYTDLARPELLKQLVNNDEEIRERALNSVKQLLKTKRTLSEEDLQKLWKGLWYTMWHSDTPLVQQSLARDLASLFGSVAPRNYNAFVHAFWVIIVREWSTLDQWRINKFYMLLRLVLGALFGHIAASDWEPEAIAEFTKTITDREVGPLSFDNTKIAHGLRLHLIDIYVDELSKAFSSEMPSIYVIKAMLAPVMDQLEKSAFKHIKQRVRDEVMDNELLAEWGVVEPKPEPEEEVEEESDFEAFD